MGALLAVLSALTYGAGDFFGGLVSRRIPTLWLLAIAQPVSGLAMIPVCLAIGGAPTGRDVAVMALAGGFVVMGLVFLYQGLAVGPMGVVAPLVAVVSAVVPVGWGVASGDELSALTSAGVVMALAAVAVIARVESDGQPLSARGVALACLAGVGFGATFIAFDVASDDSGLWPAALQRGFAMLAALLALRVLRTPRPSRAAIPWPLVGANSVFDAAGMSFFLLATREGMVSVVSVLASLYPASTVGLAVLVLHERFTRTQAVGVALAAAAVVAVVVG
jgi:drug/metabolite transporter (DMT)-like permease